MPCLFWGAKNKIANYPLGKTAIKAASPTLLGTSFLYLAEVVLLGLGCVTLLYDSKIIQQNSRRGFNINGCALH